MKTALFLYALLQLLSGCAKDNKAANTSAQNATPSCPTLEGAYKGTDPDDGKTYTFYFGTRREGAKTSYVISQEPLDADAYYQAADGQALLGTTDDNKALSRTMSCGANSLIEHTKLGNDPEETETFTDLGNGQIRVGHNGESAVMTKG